MEVFREAAENRISDYCFPAPSGVYYIELAKHWERFRADHGFHGLNLHDLRRTAITEWAKAGVPAQVIQRLSGHTTLGMVLRYTQLSPEDVREASEKLCR
jgi:integrase